MGYLIYLPKVLLVALRDVAFFPVWWYTLGFIDVVIGVKNFFIGEVRSLAIVVWIQNIFKPMYGQYDWQGRLISFFVRVVQIILRNFVLLLILILSIAIIIFWLLIPPFIVYQFAIQFIS